MELNVLIPTTLIILNEALKRVIAMPEKFCVLVNLFGGAGLYCVLMSPYPTDARGWTFAFITGLLLGASAGGLYDAGKVTIRTKLFKE